MAFVLGIARSMGAGGKPGGDDSCKIEHPLWVALTHAAELLAATTIRLVANGVARIAERTLHAMVTAQQALAEAYPGRHLLGLGLRGPTRCATRS